MPEKLRKYDAEFRDSAVRVRATGMPIRQIADDLGINSEAFGNWVAKDKVKRGEKRDSRRGDPERARECEREVEEFAMEHDVLKRSVVLWVNEATIRRPLDCSWPSRGACYDVPHVIFSRTLGVSKAAPPAPTARLSLRIR